PRPKKAAGPVSASPGKAELPRLGLHLSNFLYTKRFVRQREPMLISQAQERESPTDERDFANDAAASQSISPLSPTLRLDPHFALEMESGATLGPLTIAYQTYGELNPDKSNALLICHALSGDQYAANRHPVTGRLGWWETMVGPGRPFDTDRFFIIC